MGRLPPAAAARERGQLIPARRIPGRENLPGEGPDSRPRPTARETTMYTYRHPEIARNRIAELHHQAQRADLALAIRRARRARSDRSRHAMPARLARAARLALPRCA